MRIAIIIRRLNVSGGAQRAAILLAKELQKKGHDAALYTLAFSPADCYPDLMQGLSVVVADSEDVERAGHFGSLGGVIAPFKTLLYLNRSAKNLAAKIPLDTDVLNPHDGVAERVAVYFKRSVTKVPSVWMLNDVATRRVVVLKRKALDPTYAVSMGKRIAFWLIDLYEYVCFVRPQDTIAVLDSRDQKWARQQYYGKEAVVVRNGLSIEEFPFTPHSGIRDKKIRLLAVAILLPHRRFEDAIRAVALLRKRGFNAHLSIIGKSGDDKYAQMLRTIVRDEGLTDHVSFRGLVSHTDLLAAYRDSDIFIFPCHLQSWGLAVFEAMASGLPVIVSKTAGASEVLTHGENALLVPSHSPDKIAEAVEALADMTLYNKISRSGRSFVEREISWSRYADQLLALFDRARAYYRR